MKRLICILASAALFGACEQKTETVTPAAPPVDNKKTETNTTVVNPPAKSDTGAKEKIITTSTTNAPSPATSTETKTESTTTTTSSPNP